MTFINMPAHKRTIILAVLNIRGSMIFELLYVAVTELIHHPVCLTPELWDMIDDGLVQLDAETDRLQLTFEGWVEAMSQTENGEIRKSIQVLKRKGKTARGPF